MQAVSGFFASVSDAPFLCRFFWQHAFALNHHEVDAGRLVHCARTWKWVWCGKQVYCGQAHTDLFQFEWQRRSRQTDFRGSRFDESSYFLTHQEWIINGTLGNQENGLIRKLLSLNFCGFNKCVCRVVSHFLEVPLYREPSGFSIPQSSAIERWLKHHCFLQR